MLLVVQYIMLLTAVIVIMESIRKRQLPGGLLEWLFLIGALMSIVSWFM